MKKITAASILALAIALTPARGAILFTGSTAGCFGSCSTFSTTAFDNPGLTYTGAPFSGTTDATDNLIVNLGTFALTPGSDTYTGDSFTLEVSFTVPSGVNPNGTNSTFLAAITGQVVQGQNGSASVDFDNTLHNYTFNGGAFTLAVVDVSAFSVGHSNAVTGDIHLTQVTATPEPSTWAMMILGFAGVGLLAYRRRKGALELA